MKKRRILNVMLLGITVYCISSCNSYYYVPNSQDMAQLSEGQKPQKVSKDQFYTPENTKNQTNNYNAATYETSQRNNNNINIPTGTIPPTRPDVNRQASPVSSSTGQNFSNVPTPPQDYQEQQIANRGVLVAPVVNNSNTYTTPPSGRPVNSNQTQTRVISNTQQPQNYYYNNTNIPPVATVTPQYSQVQDYNNYTNDSYDLYNQPTSRTEAALPYNNYKKSNTASEPSLSPEGSSMIQIIPGQQYTIFLKNGAKMIGTVEENPGNNQVIIRTATGNPYITKKSNIKKVEAYK